MVRFLNPYNFVHPLPEPQNLPPLSEDTADLHLLWRCPPPPHDRYTGLSGRITCTMTAKTPVFVSDSEIVSEQNGHKTYRFFNVDGLDLIPASSLRGSIRSVFEAATNSTFGAFTFKDEPLFYRQPPEVALGLVPARVERDENSESGYRLRLLTGSYDLQLGSKNLYAAWIPSYPNPQILKKREFDRKGNSRHKHLLSPNDLVTIPASVANGRTLCWAYLLNTKYLTQDNDYTLNNSKGFPHWQVEHIATTKADAEKWFNSLPKNKKKQDKDGKPARYKLVSGYVYATGMNADVKQYERFFYYGQQEHFAQLTKVNIDAYNHLMSDYHKRKDSIANSLSNTERKGIESSRFIKLLEQLKEGTLVYADLEGTNAHPTIRAIYPVAISRTMYKRTIRDVMANHHPHLLPPTNVNELCLASRMFGWVSQEKPQNEEERRKNLEKEVAYRGRVRFSNATVTHAIRNNTQLTLSILGAPHPTSLEFYLDDVQHITARRDRQHGYNEPDAKIRGRKMYRHHKKWKTAEDNTTKTEAITNDKSDQNRTVQGVYEPDSQWEFRIEFENLQPVELGALLCTLELHEGDRQGYHRIGYGKPLGFGSVQIEVTGLDLYDEKTRYAADRRVELTDDEKKKQQQENVIRYKFKLVNHFQTAISRLYGNTPFDQLDNIVDLLALLSEPKDDLSIHYPRPEYEDRGEKGNEGFQWFVTNRDDKEGKQEHLGTADGDKGLPYYTRKQEK